MWTKTRVDAPGNTRRPRARPERAFSPIGTPGIRATAMAKIAQQSLGEEYVRFPQLAPMPISGTTPPSVPTWAPSNEPLLVSCAPTHLDVDRTRAC